ncbi:MAG: TolC family protein [Breznakibacter sp.]
MRIYLLTLMFALSPLVLWSQADNARFFTSDEIEAEFIRNNLGLMAEKLNVSIADAAVAQAKLWDNPSFSLSGMNLWSTTSQRDTEPIPPMVGSLGKNTQFSAELSQLISLSKKRAKLANVEKVSKEIAVAQFEILLSGMKLELRKVLSNTIYNQKYKEVLLVQQESLSRLTQNYRQQFQQGNISQSHLLRLRSALLMVENDINELETAINASQKYIKNLLNTDLQVSIIIPEKSREYPNPASLSIGKLTGDAVAFRTDLVLQHLQTDYYGEMAIYEKSLRVPDLDFSTSYDRRGGVWRDFVGFGIGFDLPLFNRNQGTIQTALLAQQQSKLLADQQENFIRNDVAEAYHNYALAYGFYLKNNQDALLSDMDQIYSSYTKNLLAQNISMVEYMDFMDTYRETKQKMLTCEKDVAQLFEELQYMTGVDLLSAVFPNDYLPSNK